MNRDERDYLFDRLYSVMKLLSEVLDEVGKWILDDEKDIEDSE